MIVLGIYLLIGFIFYLYLRYMLNNTHYSYLKSMEVNEHFKFIFTVVLFWWVFLLNIKKW